MSAPNSLSQAVNAYWPWMKSHLRQLVETESPSDNKAAVDRAVALVSNWATELGCRPKRHKQRDFGDILELRFGPARSTRKPILLLGHLDTVWPLGTLKSMPWREDKTRIYGPGVLDMKAGVLMALTAIRAITTAARVPHPSRERRVGAYQLSPIILLLNSDEEVGSPVSRPITERLAQQSEAVLVLEPAQGLACKTARKGVGDYRLEVTGVASHSGVDFERGHSAVLELARLLQKVAAFTDLSIGRTVNPGVIGGGTRANVIAAQAWAEVDIRIARASDAAKVARLFRSLRCEDRKCKLTITGGLNRPPMERKPGTVRLYERARKLAAELGPGMSFTLDEASTGGGSDGNFTAALNIPTLDGLGAVGEGAHAPHEHILTEYLIPRTALLAAMLAS